MAPRQRLAGISASLQEGRQEFTLKKAVVFIVFFQFFKIFFTVKFFVIGFKRGKLQAMGGNKKAEMVEFKTIR
jgi:hypothetical protein